MERSSGKEAILMGQPQEYANLNYGNGSGNGVEKSRLERDLRGRIDRKKRREHFCLYYFIPSWLGIVGGSACTPRKYKRNIKLATEC